MYALLNIDFCFILSLKQQLYLIQIGQKYNIKK